MTNVVDKLKNKKMWLAVIGLGLLVIVMIIAGSCDKRNKEKQQAEIDKYTEEQLAQIDSGNADDSLLMQMQDDLEVDFGIAPDGYIWNIDGTLLSLCRLKK